MTAFENVLEEVPAVTAMPANAFFNEAKRLVVPRLGELIRELGHVRTDKGGVLWRYENGVYRPDGEAFVKNTVKAWLSDEHRRSHIEEVIYYLKCFLPTVTDDQDPDFVNVANGLLHWPTGKLMQHDPEFISTAQIPVRWNPSAACPAIDRFLTEVVDDIAEFMVEVVGYTLYAGNPMRKAVLLFGPTGTGKSRLLLLIAALLGIENVSSIPLQTLGENRFAGAELYGKMANLAGDIDAKAVKHTDLFKQMTGGDWVTAERKYGQPFKFICKATPIFSCNEMPLSADQSDAYFGRFLVVPFTRVFGGTDRDDPHIIERLTTQAELEGLLVRAIRALGFLMERGRFDEPGSVIDAGITYRERVDSVAGFIAEECVVDPEAWVSRKVIYETYRAWCKESGRTPLMAANVYEHIRTNLAGKVQDRTRHDGTRGFAGIKVTDPRTEQWQ